MSCVLKRPRQQTGWGQLYRAGTTTTGGRKWNEQRKEDTEREGGATVSVGVSSGSWISKVTCSKDTKETENEK